MSHTGASSFNHGSAMITAKETMVQAEAAETTGTTIKTESGLYSGIGKISS